MTACCTAWIQETSVTERKLSASARTSAAVRARPAPSGVAANAMAPAKRTAKATGRHANPRSRSRAGARNEATDIDEPGTDEPSYHLRRALATKRPPGSSMLRRAPHLVNSVGA